MAELSRLSQTLLDYAQSAAKRNWSRIVKPVHLLVAIRRWDTDWFDREFPKLPEQLDSYLGRNKGDSLKPESVDPSVTSHLETVTEPEHAKELAKNLVGALGDELAQASNSVKSEAPTPDIQTKLDPSDNSEETSEDSESTASNSDNSNTGLQANTSLALRISTKLEQDPELVRGQIRASARMVMQRVLGGDDPAIDLALEMSLGPDISHGEVEDYLHLVRRLLQDDSNEASRLATQLSLAYVDAAEFAASLDAEISETELATVNEIRIESRNLLGPRLDAKHDAILEFEEKFSELVGMDSVKNDLRKRIEFMLVNKRKVSRGMYASTHRMHMAFVGNPGTGKTTVARLFGQMLNKLGLLSSEVFIETDRSGLVGEYVGHTEKKTKDVIRRANGGMLFVDEAYSLNDRYSENRKGFGEEAVDVLVKAMEDRRDSLAVVFAGYTNRMNDFLAINPGLKSRIPSVIHFPDYTNDELLEIVGRIALQRGLTIDPSAEQRLREVFASRRTAEGFGNAREAENLLDDAQRSLTERLAPLGNLATSDESRRILPEDISLPESDKSNSRVGFGRYL